MNKGKRRFYKLLMSFLILTLAFPFLNFKATAAPPGSFIAFDEDGGLIVRVTSTAATSGIRYRTVGWMVTAEPTCRDGDCRPKDFPYVEFENARDAVVSTDPPTPVPGQPITTTWYFNPDVVNGQFFRVFEDLLQPNQRLYLSAVMESYDANTGNTRSGPHYTLNAIKRAEGWAHPEDLDAYFDIDVEYNPFQPIYEKLIYVDGNGTKRQHLYEEVGRQKIYQSFTHTLRESFTIDGKTYKLYKSYISKVRDPSIENWPQYADRGDPNVATRNITPAIGGSIIVGEYRSDAPVKVKFIREDDKSELKPTEDLGEKPAGSEMHYDFKPNEFITKIVGGFEQRFQLVRTYNKNNEVKYELPKGLVEQGGMVFLYAYDAAGNYSIRAGLQPLLQH